MKKNDNAAKTRRAKMDSAAAGIVSVPLADFEAAAGLTAWQVRATNPPLEWRLCPERRLGGKTSALFATPALAPGGEKYPAVILRDAALPVHDWSPFDNLAFEVFNPEAKPVSLYVHGRGPQGAWWKHLRLVPGEQTIRIPVGGAMRQGPMNELHFFQNEPEAARQLYLGAPRLETVELRAVFGKLQRRWRELAGQTAALKGRDRQLAGQLSAAERSLAALATNLAKLAGKTGAAGLVEWGASRRRAEADLRAVADALPLALFRQMPADKVWAYGWTHGVEKVFRTEHPFRGRVGDALEVELAANEYEGVQLVLRSRKRLEDVRVTVSDLKGPRGARISAQAVEVLLVGYVNTRKPSYEVDHVGWWPDPLLNFLPGFELDAEVWQPVWLDVRTAPDQRPGVYRGRVTVSARGAAPLVAPLKVTVWDFAVPREQHLPVAMTFRDIWTLQPLYGKDPEEWKKFEAYCNGQAELESLGAGAARRLYEIRRQCQELLLAHRMVPDEIYRELPPRLDDVRRWHEAGARSFNIIHVGRADGLKAGDPYPPEMKKRILDTLADYVPRLEAAGLKDLAYIYGFDEVTQEQFAALQDIFGEIKKRFPGIPLMTTASDFTLGRLSGLDPYVDIWVPTTQAFSFTDGERGKAWERGRQVWWYTCVGPVHPFANLFIEYTAAEQRLLMGCMAKKFDSGGFLYYSSSLWCDVREKRKDGKVVEFEFHPWPAPVNRGPLTNCDGKTWVNNNGDGMLFYPGPEGPLASIRLKAMRDGLEDYEYLWLLQQAVHEAEAGRRRVSRAWLRRARAALEVDVNLVRSLTEYSVDGSDALAVRRELARLLAAR